MPGANPVHDHIRHRGFARTSTASYTDDDRGCTFLHIGIILEWIQFGMNDPNNGKEPPWSDQREDQGGIQLSICSDPLNLRQISFASGERGRIFQKRRDNRIIVLHSPSLIGAVTGCVFDTAVSNKGGELTVNWPAACVGA